jgi:uncharacterized protein (DUF488 family)
VDGHRPTGRFEADSACGAERLDRRDRSHSSSLHPNRPPAVVWTIGHSTRPLEGFLELLTENRIEAVADVRRYPGSRRWPHFAQEPLAQALQSHGLLYQWFPELGGRRTPRPDSPNTAWRSAAFRGYADYMATEAFAEGLDRLVNLASGLRTSSMCAESLWWRCHRGLIADVLRWLQFEVIHILGPDATAPHPYTPAARLVRGRLSYSAARRSSSMEGKSCRSRWRLPAPGEASAGRTIGTLKG